jgi:hypothetical protein
MSPNRKPGRNLLEIVSAVGISSFKGLGDRPSSVGSPTPSGKDDLL